MAELPPRARRIHAVGAGGINKTGTTSACAENTDSRAAQLDSWWNYLRVRGEYLPPLSVAATGVELPPRARRIRQVIPPQDRTSGTTSACAENTYCGGFLGSPQWNYLRVRGEYLVDGLDRTRSRELPPRARRIH